MNPPPPSKSEETIFASARVLPAAERTGHLNRECGTNLPLRRRVEELLRAEEAVGFMAAPAAGLAAIVRPLGVTVEVPDTENSGTKIGPYTLLQKIGEGGFGVVWMAEQQQPIKRHVALKIVKIGMDTEEVIARFEAERQSLALMEHPNIACVFDAGATDAGRPYFVMELVRGVAITRYCEENRLSAEARLRLFITVCHAVQHAHQKGVIHRDLKPSNILVTLHDGVAMPKVIDFGIAKATGARLTEKTFFTQFHAFIGTPAYTSPEQLAMSGLDVDTRSDIYSLGVVLYELLAGQPPFDSHLLVRSGLEAMRKTIREIEPMRPSTKLGETLEAAERKIKSLSSDAPRSEEEVKACLQARLGIKETITLLRGDLDWIVMKCLEKDRTRRYETANGLAGDIQRHLIHEAVLARPQSAAYRFQKLIRRNKLAFAAASAVTLTLITGLSFSTWAFLRERKAHAGEIEERNKTHAEKIVAQRHLYIANMNLAQQAWAQNNIDRLVQLLDETRESPDRGFEWYYWQRQTHLALKTFRGHSSRVTAVAFSPDGQRIVTGSFDHTAKIWDVASGRERLTLTGHSSEIRTAAISPDGQWIATGGHDQTAMLWDAANGRVLRPLKGHSGQIYSVAFSSDSRQIVTGGEDNTGRVWEAPSGNELLTLTGHTARVFSAAFSPDGEQIVTGSADWTAKLWNAASGNERITLRGHSHAVMAVAFSPDGQRIVTASFDQTAKVWESANGRELVTLKGHVDVLRGVAFSPDGQKIVTGSLDQTAKVWDTATGRELFTLKGHSHRVLAVAFSPDGQRIVTGSRDHSAKLWDAGGGRDLLTLNGHGAAVYAVASSPDSRRIVTGSWDATAKIWDPVNGRELITFKGHSLGVLSVAFSPDGKRILTGSWDETARMWDEASGRQLLTLKGHGASIWSVAFSPDGRRIVTGSYDKTARVWDAANGEELLRLKGHTARIWSAAFSPIGERIVTGSDDQTAKVWEAVNGRELFTLKGHSGLIKSVTFSPDGQRIATASFDQTAKVWDAASGRELFTLQGHTHQVRSVAFSGDGRRIVTGSADQTARVWDAASGLELLTLRGHASIWSVAFSPDGRWIAAGCDDGTSKVWQTAGAEEVHAWRREERAAEEDLANRQRERSAAKEPQRIARALDPGAMKEWLVLAPIPLNENQAGAQGLDIEQIAGEARLQPKAGEGTMIRNVGLRWQEVAQEDYVIDFNVIIGDQTQVSVAYAVCYIMSEVEQRGLQMLVGSDDEAKVYLNGKQIYKSPVGRGFVADHDSVSDIVLNAGLNTLVFKVVNELVDWKGSIRFTDARGNPVKGIKVTLTP